MGGFAAPDIPPLVTGILRHNKYRVNKNTDKGKGNICTGLVSSDTMLAVASSERLQASV